MWRGARDDGNLDKPIWRWAEAFQNDWAARADWCVVPQYADANHPPTAEAAALEVVAAPGDAVALDVSRSTDPDGDKLAFRWWQYREVDTYPGEVEIVDPHRARASLTVPHGAKPGATIHLIAEVTDDGWPPLTRYARVVVTVDRN